MLRSYFLKCLRLLTLVVILPAISTSCLDIEEKIALNRDGSGSYHMVLDMSEIMTMLETMGGADGETGSMTNSVDSAMDVTVAKLNEIEGISNVEQSGEDFVFSLRYDFADIDALNAANSINQEEDPSTANMPTSALTKGQFEWTKKTFRRISPDMADVFDADDPEMEQAMGMIRMMMGEASYTSLYTMPGKVKSIQNEDAVIEGR